MAVYLHFPLWLSHFPCLVFFSHLCLFSFPLGSYLLRCQKKRKEKTCSLSFCSDIEFLLRRLSGLVSYTSLECAFRCRYKFFPQNKSHCNSTFQKMFNPEHMHTHTHLLHKYESTGNINVHTELKMYA